MSIWQRIGLVVFSAGLVVLTFPPFDLSWLALVAWLPLLYALKDCSWRVAGRLGLLHGWLAFGGTLCWLWNIFQAGAIGLWTILALFTALFGVAMALIHQSVSQVWTRIALVTVVWGGIEYFRCEVFTLHFPWITPGTGIEPGWLNAVVGVYGVSALILFAAVSMVERKYWVGGVALLALVAGLFTRVIGEDKMNGEVIAVAVVQSEECYFGAYADLTETIDQPVDVILWPEYAISNDLMTSPRDLARAKQLLVDKGAKVLVAGSRTNLDDGDYHNTALTIDRDGELGRHFKNRTVHFFKDGKPGTESAVIDTPLGKIGTPVCFDCDYGDVLRKAVAGGAEMLLVPSMDAASWGERQHLQHAELFKHRAAENRRYIAVAATSGRSQVIAPWGGVVLEMPLMEEGIGIGYVFPRSGLTLFTRGGWLIGPVMMWAAGVVLICLPVVLFRKSRIASQQS